MAITSFPRETGRHRPFFFSVGLFICCLQGAQIELPQYRSSVWSLLRYKMNSFRGKMDSFYVILKRKYSFRRDSNPQSMDYEANSLPLSFLTSWWMGVKVEYYQVQNSLFAKQPSLRNCHELTSTNCEQFRTKCCVKIAATLTLASTDLYLSTPEIFHYILNSRMTSLSMDICFNVIDWTSRPLEFFTFR